MTSLPQQRQAHVNALIVDNRLCMARTGVVPVYRAATADKYVIALYKIGSWLAPWQVDARAIEKTAGRCACALIVARPALMSDAAWLMPTVWMRTAIAAAMAKHYNGALINGRPLSPWLPYGESSPIWDLAQIPPRETPHVRSSWACDRCGRALHRHLELGDSWWEDDQGGRTCQGDVPDWRGNYADLGPHLVNGRTQARSEYDQITIYRQMATKWPLQPVDPAVAAGITGRHRTKYRKALVRDQKKAGLL